MLKLLPYIVVVGALLGVYSYGYNQGKQKQKIVYKEKVIEAGRKDIETDKRQEKWLAIGERDHIDWLYAGEF